MKKHLLIAPGFLLFAVPALAQSGGVISGGNAAVGPASAVANDLAVFGDVTGKVIADAGVALADIVTANTTSGVTPGTYGSSSRCPVGITVAANGLVTAIGDSTSCPGGGGGGGAGIDFFGTFSHSGNNFSVAASGFTLTDGYRVRGIPDASSTAAPFLNVETSGSLPIYRQTAGGGFITAGGGDVVSGVIQDFTYDASLAGGAWVITSVAPSGSFTVAVNTTVNIPAFTNGACLYKVTAAGKTIAFPASTSLGNGGACYVWAFGADTTLASSGGDSINATTVKNGQIALVTSDGVSALSAQVSGIPVGTSGGIPYYNSSSTVLGSAALTANMPVIGGGAGTAPSVGTVSGNTTKFATVSGSLTNGNLTKADASGNIVDAGAAPGAGGGGDTQGALASTWYALEKGTLASGGATTASRCFARPFTFSTARTIDAVAVRPSTIGSTNVQIALYANNASTNRPTSTAICSTSGTANNTGTPASQACSTGSLTPNLIYWAETNTNDSTAAYSNISSANSNMAWLIGSATLGTVSAGSTSTITNLNASCTYGTWGDQTSTSWTEGTSNNWAEVFVHLSSVP